MLALPTSTPAQLPGGVVDILEIFSVLDYKFLKYANNSMGILLRLLESRTIVIGEFYPFN